MSKVSMTIDVDPYIIDRILFVMEQRNVMLTVELKQEIKKLFDSLVLLFDQEEHVIQFRMK